MSTWHEDLGSFMLPTSQMDVFIQWGIEVAHFCLEVGCHQDVERHLLPVLYSNTCPFLYHQQADKYLIMISPAIWTCGYRAGLYFGCWEVELAAVGPWLSERFVIPLIFSLHQNFVSAVSISLNGISDENRGIRITKIFLYYDSLLPNLIGKAG